MPAAGAGGAAADDRASRVGAGPSGDARPGDASGVDVAGPNRPAETAAAGEYTGRGGKIARVLSPTELVLSDGSHWRGSRRPLPWTRKGDWRRGDPIRVLRVRGAAEGEHYLLVNGSRRTRLPDAGGAFAESRMHAAFLGRADPPPRRGLLGWLGGG